MNAKKRILKSLLIVFLIASTVCYVLVGLVLSADLFWRDYTYNLKTFSESGRKTVLESIPVNDEAYIEILTSGYHFGFQDSYSATLLRVPEKHKDDFEETLMQYYTKNNTGPATGSMFLDLYKNDLLKKYSDIPHTSYFKHKDVAKSFVTIHSYDTCDGYTDYMVCGEFDALLNHTDVSALIEYQNKLTNPQKTNYPLIISIVFIAALSVITVMATSKAKKMSRNNIQDNANDTQKSILIILFATVTATTAILAGWKIITAPHNNIFDTPTPKSVLLFNTFVVFCVIQMLICEIDAMYNLYYYFFAKKENNTKTTLNGTLFVLSSVLFASLSSFVFFEKYSLSLITYMVLLIAYYIMRIICLSVKQNGNTPISN